MSVDVFDAATQHALGFAVKPMYEDDRLDWGVIVDTFDEDVFVLHAIPWLGALVDEDRVHIGIDDQEACRA